MTVVRRELQIDVTDAVGQDVALQVAATVVSPVGVELGRRPIVVAATPGGTYNRRYWDLQPPGLSGYSQAEYMAERGVIFVACDYLGGGDSSRPEDADFIGLEVQADAAHGVFEHLRQALAEGTLIDAPPPLDGAFLVGVGQSLGGFITIIQQGIYADYPALAIFGASPLLYAEKVPDDSTSSAEQMATIIKEMGDRPMYQNAPREQFRAIFHGPDVGDDLVAYDENECHTVLTRAAASDGMTPGFARPFADRISCPLFLAFGAADITADAHAEATGYPAANDITIVTFANMAHMHNFAGTRVRLWDRFLAWLTEVVAEA